MDDAPIISNTSILEDRTYSLPVPPDHSYDLRLQLYREKEDCSKVNSIVVRGRKYTVQAGSSGENFDYLNKGATITGSITYDSLPVLMAKVLLWDGTSLIGYSMTDQNGNYNFYNVPAGDYRIYGVYNGKKTQEQMICDLETNSEEIANLNFDKYDLCLGDLDGDGDIDGSDLALFILGEHKITLKEFIKGFGIADSCPPNPPQCPNIITTEGF